MYLKEKMKVVVQLLRFSAGIKSPASFYSTTHCLRKKWLDTMSSSGRKQTIIINTGVSVTLIEAESS